MNSLLHIQGELDKEIDRVRGNVWRITWNGKPVVARGKASWCSYQAARQAFHSQYCQIISEAILTANGQPTHTVVDNRYGQMRVPVTVNLRERNAVIEALVKQGTLEFKKQT